MKNRTVALALIAVFVVTAIGALIVAITGGGDGDVVAGPAATTAEAALNDEAQELVDRLVEARKRPLHLTYAGGLAAAPETGKLTIEIWWDGELTRQDLTTEAPAGKQQQSSFALPSGNVTCVKGADGAWACQRAASVATAGGKPASIIDSLVAQLNGRPVTVAKAKVGDTDADCYTLDPTTDDGVCLRKDGVPVKFTVSGSELVATGVATDVDDDDFKPPAAPTELPATPTTPTSGG